MIKDHVFRTITKRRDACCYFSCERPASEHITVAGFRNRRARLKNGQ